MEPEKISGLFDTIRRSIELYREAEATMRKLILAVAREHLKQNGVGQTVYDWQDTHAALKLMTGESTHFTSPGMMYLSKSRWPTHLRLSDLKPVRVKSCSGDTCNSVRELRVRRGAAIVDHLCDEVIVRDYVRIREEEI